jgi:predicted Zn-dependent protease with MMP-like domain
MKQEIREMFDVAVEEVVAELPQQVKDFMENVPLVVDDIPSPPIMRKMRIRHPSHLLGLYTGTPLIKRSIEQLGIPPDVIHIFRLGILSHSRGRDGEISQAKLRRQIRRTILHEYGHHVGLTERDLRELGYG